MSNAKKTVGTIKAHHAATEAQRERDWDGRRLQAITSSRKLVKTQWEILSYDKRWANVLKLVGKPLPRSGELGQGGLENALLISGFCRNADWETGNNTWPEYVQARAVSTAIMMIRKARKAAKKPKPYKPLWDSVQANMIMANSVASPVLGSSVKFHHGPGDKSTGSIRISPMWSRMVDQIGGAVLGARFITRAEKVDEVGGFDLFQVEYYTNPAANGPRWGYVAKMRGGTTRGFGDKPEIALQWTERQVVIHSTRKLTQ